MKTNELMIGDWVNYRLGWLNEENGQIEYESGTGFPVRIEFIYKATGGEGLVQYNDGVNDGMEAAEYELFPIPLTPEILEKNGFHWGHTASEEDFCSATGCGYPDKGWCFDEGAGELKIIFPNEADGGLIRLDDENFDRHLELIFVKPLYVHQLQHALKLCGIDKEVQL